MLAVAFAAVAAAAAAAGDGGVAADEDCDDFDCGGDARDASLAVAEDDEEVRAAGCVAADAAAAGADGFLLPSRTSSGVLSDGPCGRIWCCMMDRRARAGPSACSRGA